MHLFRLAVILAALALPVAVARQPTTRASEPVEAMSIKVVPLTYAWAGELACTLSLVAPPRVRIVPYYPTNSLIISGPPAAVEQLIDIIKPSAGDDPSPPRSSEGAMEEAARAAAGKLLQPCFSQHEEERSRR